MIEIWKDIPGFEGLYQVSSLGRVKNCVRQKMLKGSKVRGGYLVVTLCKGAAIRERPLIHKLVAKAFIANPFNKPVINHKNAKTNDNHVGNLEWCTQQENIIYAHAIGNMGGTKNANALFNEQDILNMKYIYLFGMTLRMVAKRYKVRTDKIRNILSGKSYVKCLPHINFFREDKN